MPTNPFIFGRVFSIAYFKGALCSGLCGTMKCESFRELGNKFSAWDEIKMWNVYEAILNELLDSDYQEIDNVTITITDYSDNEPRKIHVLIDFDEDIVCVW